MMQYDVEFIVLLEVNANIRFFYLQKILYCGNLSVVHYRSISLWKFHCIIREFCHSLTKKKMKKNFIS